MEERIGFHSVLVVDEDDDPDTVLDEVLAALLQRYGFSAMLAALADLVQEKRK